jgi:hypothetical protein
MGFNEKQVIEAYLVTDKKEDLTINYLLSTDAGSPSVVRLLTFLLIFTFNETSPGTLGTRAFIRTVKQSHIP